MNIPNWLSSFRLCLVPVFPVLLFSDLPGAENWAAGVFLLAALTDVVDGYIARKYNMVTKLGRILDPLADKLMVAMVLVCVAWLWRASPAAWWLWGAVAAFFVKEALMGVGAIVMYRKVSDVNPSAFPGKFSATLFIIVCTLLLLFQEMPGALAAAMVVLATASSVYALFYYLFAYLRSTRRSAT
jgi:cardiolipin synthase